MLVDIFTLLVICFLIGVENIVPLLYVLDIFPYYVPQKSLWFRNNSGQIVAQLYLVITYSFSSPVE